MTVPTIQCPGSSPAPTTDLISLVLTCRAVYIKAIHVLFQRAVICHSRKFGKFLATIQRRPSLGSCVRSLDFRLFNPFLIFSTAAARTQAQNLTSKTLMKCLQLTPFLQEFIAQEHIDNHITRDVLAKLFFGMPSLRTIDFRGCSSTSFEQSFHRLVHDSWPKSLLLTQVSFHECLSVPSSVFETILPRLHQVTQLDLAGTAVNDEALQNFPSSARLTHLNLSRCLKLSTKAIVIFLTEHPSIIFTLRSLCIGGNPLLSKRDVDSILQHLPRTLQSLSLKSINMVPSQVYLLQYTAKKIEHLSIGRGLCDIDNLLSPNQQWLFSSLQYLDISDLGDFGNITSLLPPSSAPLDIIELDERVWKRAVQIRERLELMGWVAEEFSRRYWLIRRCPHSIQNLQWWKERGIWGIFR
ncbi:hypothetical protein EDB81DRAFT_692839 [Dactylonectria macrodidyma]|uniref:F-box/LRR-repeat protein 15-like leucin rich repeat domain-containing protein n=1 Tax=Dactylonectria macrodidyma TaxID=307937 RepID=A0A9P9IXN5_9HYPO|nr:hypothetical protein EDB81DRAFT_692839 [Dactylonectria macrodidyma]